MNVLKAFHSQANDKVKALTHMSHPSHTHAPIKAQIRELHSFKKVSSNKKTIKLITSSNFTHVLYPMKVMKREE